MHLVDVVVPVRDAARHLPTFLDTVRANALDGARFVVVDDHSTDETPHLLDAAARDLSVLHVVRADRQVGAAHARNLALEVLDARYLTFLDVDDWTAPGRLAALVAAAERTGASVVRTDHVRVDGYRRTLERAPWHVRGAVADAREGIGDSGGRALVDYPYLWAGIYDVTRLDPALLPFDVTLRTASDRPWFWRLHLGAPDVTVVDAPAYFYRRTAGSGSLTQAGEERLLDFLPAYHQVLDLAARAGVAAYGRRAAYGACRIVAFHVEKRGRLSRALQSRLLEGSCHLLARPDDDTFAAAVREFAPPERQLLQALRHAGRGGRP